MNNNTDCKHLITTDATPYHSYARNIVTNMNMKIK